MHARHSGPLDPGCVCAHMTNLAWATRPSQPPPPPPGTGLVKGGICDLYGSFLLYPRGGDPRTKQGWGRRSQVATAGDRRAPLPKLAQSSTSPSCRYRASSLARTGSLAIVDEEPGRVAPVAPVSPDSPGPLSPSASPPLFFVSRTKVSFSIRTNTSLLLFVFASLIRSTSPSIGPLFILLLNLRCAF